MQVPVFLVFVLSFLLSFPMFAQEYLEQTVSPSQLNSSFKKIGKLDFKRTSSLSFKTPGYLTKLNVDEGDYFQTDSILASLDTAELIANKNAKYAQLLNAKRNVNRIKQLIANNLSSEKALDDANTVVTAVRADYKIAYYNLEKSQLVAPFSGVVIERFTEVNELQSVGKVALIVAALENNWIVKVALTSQEIEKIRKKQKVSVLINNIGWVDAEVSKVPVKANKQSQLFDVEVMLLNLEANVRLISGQIAQVKFDFSQKDLVLKLPIEGMIEVNNNGMANFLVANVNDTAYKVKSFPVLKLDHKYIYVTTHDMSTSLNVVTHGWQHFNREQ